MTDVNQEVETNESDELTALKARADLMGISYHPSIGLDKLKAKVNERLVPADEVVTKAKDVVKKEEKLFLTAQEYNKDRKVRGRREANRLVRVRVTCMNPNKKNWEGEIISVGSAKLGTFKKFVPFNLESGYHIPYIIYKVMKDRKCSIPVTGKDAKQGEANRSKVIPEFSIEVLPPLTAKELNDLAIQQARSGSVGD